MTYTKTNWINDTTPINATNLNHIEDGIKNNDIGVTENRTNIETTNQRIDDLYYKDSDTYNANSDFYVFPGMVTGAGKNIRFTITMPKNAKNISSATITSLILTIRGIGGYIQTAETNFLTNSNTLSYNAKVSNNLLAIEISGNNAWAGVTNNTPISVTANGLSVTFNE